MVATSHPDALQAAGHKPGRSEVETGSSEVEMGRLEVKTVSRMRVETEREWKGSDVPNQEENTAGQSEEQRSGGRRNKL